MGSCLCKKKSVGEGDTDLSHGDSTANMSSPADVIAKKNKEMDIMHVEQLVLEMLRIIGCFSESDDDSPIPLVKLHCIADKEEGWSQVVMSLIHTIPLDEPLGPSTITIIFDDTPLPPKETVVALVNRYNLSKARALKNLTRTTMIRYERNICVVLGCIAERYAGPWSAAVLSQNTLDYLVTYIRDSNQSCLVLYALVALEKFAQTIENKWSITQYLAKENYYPLLKLQDLPEDDFVWRQVAFCARWTLDNIFVADGRQLSYETQNTSGINAMLNTKDVSEYLKISADGLEARCDSHSFESVRCTFQCDHDVWFYEVEIITHGVMQIGWASKSCVFQNHDGYGIGDDGFSLSYDGCRRLIWHKAQAAPIFNVPAWKPGDILGCLIDIPREEAIFYLNGQKLPTCSDIFHSARDGYYAAASFMAHQQCRFNFGNKPFRYPPRDRSFKVINEHGTLTNTERMVIPRRIHMQEVRNAPIVDASCVVCCDDLANSLLSPCQHTGFCARCAEQLSECPFCRVEVWSVESIA